MQEILIELFKNSKLLNQKLKNVHIPEKWN